MSAEHQDYLPSTEELLKQCYITSAELVGGVLTEVERARVQGVLGSSAIKESFGLVLLKRVEPDNQLHISIIALNPPGTAARFTEIAD